MQWIVEPSQEVSLEKEGMSLPELGCASRQVGRAVLLSFPTRWLLAHQHCITSFGNLQILLVWKLWPLADFFPPKNDTKALLWVTCTFYSLN